MICQRLYKMQASHWKGQDLRFSGISCPLKMKLIVCTEKSVGQYRYTLSDIAARLHLGGAPQSNDGRLSAEAAASRGKCG